MTQEQSKARPKIRLFVPEHFSAGGALWLEDKQAHYVSQVMRMREGDPIALFNGSQGVWLGEVTLVEKRRVQIMYRHEITSQVSSPDLWLAFAPIKNKSELVVEKAVELGVAKILPVVTQHAVVRSVNEEKLRAHAIEAAEQCERHDVPEIEPYSDIRKFLGNWPEDRTLLYGDESGGGEPINALLPTLPKGKYGLLIGPEGGFSAEEHHLLKLQPFVKSFGLGPRILRADTAAVAALACIQSWLGDWDRKPHFQAGS